MHWVTKKTAKYQNFRVHDALAMEETQLRLYWELVMSYRRLMVLIERLRSC
jgi:hypothetical protein